MTRVREGAGGGGIPGAGAVTSATEALAAGDPAEAERWLDRAWRLAPGDLAAVLALAAACLARNPERALALFLSVPPAVRPREGWFGVVAARLGLGDRAGAERDLGGVLGRFSVPPGMAALSERVAGEAWCGMAPGGAVLTPPGAAVWADRRPGLARLDFDAAGVVRVTLGGREVLGSPLRRSVLLRTEGRVWEATGGLRGWAWHPGDPERKPTVVLCAANGVRRVVRCTTLAAGAAGAGVMEAGPLARPMAFAVGARLLAGLGTVRVRGLDGRALRTGPPPPVPSWLSALTRPSPRGRSNQTSATASVVMITHADGGGVERVVQAEAAAHRAAGLRPLILRPDPDRGRGLAVRLEDPIRRSGACFPLPRARAALLRRLRAANPRTVSLHHLLGHPPTVAGLIAALGVPYDVHIHDFAWCCPRVQMIRPLDGAARYCGEPELAGCEACVAAHGSLLDEPIGVRALHARSAALFARARRVIAPSADAARRIARHFPGVMPEIAAPEDDAALPGPAPPPPARGRTRIVVVGALGPAKGLEVLIACATDAAARNLPLEFAVAGYTEDDATLFATGRVFVTGPFRPEEASALIRAQGAHVAFLPSIWPETWCFALTDAWRAGLDVVAFDLGAPAERIRATGRGFLLPLGLDAGRINHILLARTRAAVHE